MSEITFPTVFDAFFNVAIKEKTEIIQLGKHQKETATLKQQNVVKDNNHHSMNVDGLISDLALILVLGAITTLVFKKLKQPLVLGYIVAGFIAGSNFKYFPSVGNEANVEFWAQIGIIVLLFSLGLEFSFKKLMNVGGSAVVTALIIVSGMMGIGFLVGRFLDYSFIDSLFLGGMLSMSSTTIIIKAFTDLNMRQRKFVSLVFAVLICEDLFAVVMMVLLSSVALNHSVEGPEMLFSILKLVFFLVIWFTVGVFLIPTFFNKWRRFINEETLLVLSMGLCMLMAVFSVYSGFSMALGAFVMGSIFAGTCEAEHIEKVTKPVKDLFGAVFFISVGMMVNPVVIMEHWGTICILAAVVIVGMILFGTFGMLVTGQSLRIAMESGFSLTQIGEFAFIIASLGMSLHVLEPAIYPIVVAVSVITTFFTPYFIKSALPCYDWVASHLPARFGFLLTSYSKRASTVPESQTVWKAVLSKYVGRILMYSTLVIALMWLSRTFFIPFTENLLDVKWGKLLGTVVSVSAMSPFILALSNPAIKKSELAKIKADTGSASTVPIVVMGLLRIVVAFILIVGYLGGIYSHKIGLSVGLALLVVALAFLSKRANRRLHSFETTFLKNLNERELRRSGRDNNLVSDFHLAYMSVGYSCPFVGEKLGNSNIRKDYGVNVVSIQRGGDIYPVPSRDMRVFPGDLLGVIGTDEQIQNILSIIEDAPNVETVAHADAENNMEFMHFEINENSQLIGKSTVTSRLRGEYSALLVSIQRGSSFLKPNGDEKFQAHDVLWIVGNAKKLASLRKS